jgi:PAS domain S-box-containing protein
MTNDFGKANKIFDNFNKLEKDQIINYTTYLLHLVNSADDIICIKDGGGRWLLANESDLELFKLTEVDYQGKTDADLADYTMQIYKEAFLTCMVTDEAAWDNKMISRIDEKIPIDNEGNFKIYDVVKQPLFDEKGERKALIVVGRDVTEMRKINEIEKQSALKNRVLQEFALQMLSAKTTAVVFELLTQKISYLNNNYFTISMVFTQPNISKFLTSYPLETAKSLNEHFPNVLTNFTMKVGDDIKYKTIEKFKNIGIKYDSLYNASLQQIPKYLSKSIQSYLCVEQIHTFSVVFEKEIFGYISFFLKIGQNIEDYDIVESLIFIAAQTIKRIIDNEEMNKAKQDLEQSNLIKEKFFTLLSQDLEEPLKNLLKFTSNIRDNFNKIPIFELQKIIQDLFENVDYTNYLIENLFEWSKIEMHNVNFNPREFSVSEFYKNNEALILEGMKKKNIQFINSINSNHFVEVDSDAITMVFRNIIKNAIKFTRPFGEIEIKSDDSVSFIRIQVIDNGIGIQPEDMAKLFRIDLKFSTIGTDEEIGTGLGLIIAKHYVEMHGGTLNIESIADKGTVVYFTLPKRI